MAAGSSVSEDSVFRVSYCGNNRLLSSLPVWTEHWKSLCIDLFTLIALLVIRMALAAMRWRYHNFSYLNVLFQHVCLCKGGYLDWAFDSGSVALWERASGCAAQGLGFESWVDLCHRISRATAGTLAGSGPLTSRHACCRVIGV